jgi:hypothetical protein
MKRCRAGVAAQHQQAGRWVVRLTGSRRLWRMASMQRQTLRVAMDDLLDAMTFSEDDPMSFFLDLETGKVESRFSPEVYGAPAEDEDDFDQRFADDPQRYKEIPKYAGHDEYNLMCRFADAVDEEDIRERLDIALQGKGTFRRFRDVVFRYPDLKAKWFATRQDALLKEALDWLESLDIAPIYELRRNAPEPAAAPAQRASAAPAISLLDMLLLGAPEGKTELLDGRVLRQLNTRSPSEARGVFKHLARELCEYHGVPWRKRFIENTSHYAIERAHLQVDGTTVRLWIDVPPAIWKAFE